MGMRDSVASSVWKPSFKKSLETFPDFEAVHMDFGNPGCDACNLGGRTSTIVGRVSGEPYEKLTYEVRGSLWTNISPSIVILLRFSHSARYLLTKTTTTKRKRKGR